MNALKIIVLPVLFILPVLFSGCRCSHSNPREISREDSLKKVRIDSLKTLADTLEIRISQAGSDSMVVLTSKIVAVDEQLSGLMSPVEFSRFMMKQKADLFFGRGK